MVNKFHISNKLYIEKYIRVGENCHITGKYGGFPH